MSESAQPSNSDAQQMLAQLEQIKQALKDSQLWSDTPPEPQAFASTAPFCFDRMDFEQWLQWVFLPKMAELIEAGKTPPAGCSMAPLAEHQFAEYAEPTDQLVIEISRFDQLALEYFGIEPE